MIALARRLRTPLQHHLFGGTQLIALGIAAFCGWHGYQLVYDDKFAIDRASAWYGVGLLLLVYFAWNGSRPHVERAPRAVIDYARAHPVELVTLAGILGVSLFVQLYEWGTLPPAHYLYGEEGINGGIAWRILRGDRLFIYPLVRYSTALGLWLFGPSALGLRGVMVAAGFVVVIPFYLLMRDLVSRPAALFATMLLASMRVFADAASHMQVPMLGTVLLAWTMVRGLKTGNAVWFVPGGVLAGVLSYEYESWKAVPLFAGAFLIFFCVRALVWPIPRTLAAAGERLRRLPPRAVKPLLVVAVVVPMMVGPMFAQLHRGEHVYFSSLNRQEADREHRGTPGRFAPNATEQLQWAVQVFTPRLKVHYPTLGPIAAREVIDGWTSVFIWLGVAAAALTFWRGMRLFFVMWFLGGVAATALLTANFSAWKVVGFLPPALVLVGFVVDDALAVVRKLWRPLLPVAMAGLVLVGALVLKANVSTLRSLAHDQAVLREYSGIPSVLYSVCDNLRERPKDNYAFVQQRARSGWGFSGVARTDAERRGAWTDFTFVCWGLEGRSLADIRELWPPAFDQDRPVTVLITDPVANVEAATADLTRAMPELGAPDLVKQSPGKVFRIVAYDTTLEELTARQGLVSHRWATDGSFVGEGITSGSEIVTKGVPGGDGRLELSGLVYVRKNGGEEMALTVPGAASVEILLDGKPSFTGSPTAPPQVSYAPLAQGWHLVTIRSQGTSSGAVLAWQTRDGQVTSLTPDDFFALPDGNVWTHTRTFVFDATKEQVTTMRVDFAPYAAALDGLRFDTRSPLETGWSLVTDEWRARWHVARAGKYVAQLSVPLGTVKLTVDGRVALNRVPGGPSESTLDLAAGDHDIEIIFSGNAGVYFGGSITVRDEQGEVVPLTLSPF